MTDTTTPDDPDARLDEFRAALDDVGVTYETTDPDGARSAIDRAIEPPAVGVPLDDVLDADSIDGESSMPATVKTEFRPSDLRTARTGVTPVRAGVADVGSLLVPSTSRRDELVSLYPERHVAVLHASDVLPDLDAAVAWVDDEVETGRDSYVLATGASATADMGALVEGVHGPKAVHLVIVDP